MGALTGALAGGYLPASFLDWDGRVSAVVFTTGCNFRCPWCHNGALVTGDASLPVEKIISDITRRAKFLDGVVVSGGEPTISPYLKDFLVEMKSANLPVKLDTNGTRPEILRELLSRGLLSRVAMDIKAPLDAASYSRVAGVAVDTEAVKSSVGVIKKSGVSYEFRTTYVPSLHDARDLALIRDELSDDAHWVVQLFKPNGCLDARFLNEKAATPEKIKEILRGVKIRG